MNWFKKIFFKPKTELQNCQKVIRKLGFRYNSSYGTFHKDFDSFDCAIWIYDDTIKLKIYSKGGGYSETEMIGPPLPNKEQLTNFILYHT